MEPRPLHTSLSRDALGEYLRRQLAATFPDDGDLRDVARIVDYSLERLERCFAGTVYGLNWKNGASSFDHLNADQYCVFLYFAANTAFRRLEHVPLAAKLFYLNKSLHGFHCMYDTQLPDVFVVVHGTGIVLGKATYHDGLVIMHQCTVGANFDHEIPELGPRVVMYPGSSVIGHSVIGHDSCLASGAFVNDTRIAPETLVIGRSPDLLLKRNRADRLKRFLPPRCADDAASCNAPPD
jgi:serine O-acetyltransferase